MLIDWKKVWQEFEDELSNRLQEGALNEWSMQQEIIERVVTHNLTPDTSSEPNFKIGQVRQQGFGEHDDSYMGG